MSGYLNNHSLTDICTYTYRCIYVCVHARERTHIHIERAIQPFSYLPIQYRETSWIHVLDITELSTICQYTYLVHRILT